jgi:small redox-active disulfide protein 2
VKVEVLGKGCSRCELTERLVREAAARCGVAVEIEKVQDLQRIAAMGVMATPAVAIDGKLVHAGRVPLASEVEGWLTAGR